MSLPGEVTAPATAPGTGSNRPRVGYLDGLRGLAALLVVFCHLAAAYLPASVFGTTSGGLTNALYSVPLLNVLLQGNFMVCLFYALSGFALSNATISRGGRGSVISGLVRRYPRLAIPTFSATLLAGGMLSLSMFPVEHAARISHSQSWLGTFWQFHPTVKAAAKEGAIGVFRAPLPVYDPPLWTMHNELRGSLLVFAVLLLLPRRALRVAAYIVLAFLTHGSYLLAFVGGMAICEARVAAHERSWHLPDRFRATGVAGVVAVGLYGLVLGGYPAPSAKRPRFYGRLLPHMFGAGDGRQLIGSHVLGAVFVLAAVVALAPLQRALQTRSMRFLGRISFALYLLHFLVLGSLGAAILIALDGVLPYYADLLAVTIVVVVVSIAASWVFTVLIDEPGVLWIKRAYQWCAQQVSRRVSRFVPARKARSARAC